MLKEPCACIEGVHTGAHIRRGGWCVDGLGTHQSVTRPLRSGGAGPSAHDGYATTHGSVATATHTDNIPPAPGEGCAASEFGQAAEACSKVHVAPWQLALQQEHTNKMRGHDVASHQRGGVLQCLDGCTPMVPHGSTGWPPRGVSMLSPAGSSAEQDLVMPCHTLRSPAAARVRLNSRPVFGAGLGGAALCKRGSCPGVPPTHARPNLEGGEEPEGGTGRCPGPPAAGEEDAGNDRLYATVLSQVEDAVDAGGQSQRARDDRNARARVEQGGGRPSPHPHSQMRMLPIRQDSLELAVTGAGKACTTAGFVWDPGGPTVLAPTWRAAVRWRADWAMPGSGFN